VSPSECARPGRLLFFFGKYRKRGCFFSLLFAILHNNRGRFVGFYRELYIDLGSNTVCSTVHFVLDKSIANLIEPVLLVLWLQNVIFIYYGATERSEEQPLV